MWSQVGLDQHGSHQFGLENIGHWRLRKFWTNSIIWWQSGLDQICLMLWVSENGSCWWFSWISYSKKFSRSFQFQLDFQFQDIYLFIQWVLSSRVESVQKQLNVSRPFHLEALEVWRWKYQGGNTRSIKIEILEVWRWKYYKFRGCNFYETLWVFTSVWMDLQTG